MATWVEDIIQALRNLGGRGSLKQIYNEVALIRTEKLPQSYKASIRERIESHSSDSLAFKGKDYFKKIDTGVWELRNTNSIMNNPLESKNKQSSMSNLKESLMSTNFSFDDPDLLTGNQMVEFSIESSFEEISNIFQTIKEYRDYANPDNDEWLTYVHEIFHILGYKTINFAPRLFTLNIMGSNQKSNVILCVVGPNENFEEIVTGMTWESYLFFASKYFQVDWVILTNGLQFKVINFLTDESSKKFFQCEIDEIITNGKLDSFFTLFKIISVIGNNQKVFHDSDSNRKKRTRSGARNLSDRHYKRKDFWDQLLSRAKNKTQLHAKKSPSNEHWLSAGTGKSGISYNYIILKDGARVELYIDNGDYNFNKKSFDSLLKNKIDIENVFGDSLSWERLDDKRASMIRYPISGIGLQNEDQWPELQDQLIESMIKFDKALQPYIQKLD